MGASMRVVEATGFEWQVDHIEPINGRDVSGLHVIDNVRVIPASLNYAKKNNQVDMPHWLGLEVLLRIQSDATSAAGSSGPNYGQATGFNYGTH